MRGSPPLPIAAGGLATGLEVSAIHGLLRLRQNARCASRTKGLPEALTNPPTMRSPLPPPTFPGGTSGRQYLIQVTVGRRSRSPCTTLHHLNVGINFLAVQHWTSTNLANLASSLWMPLWSSECYELVAVCPKMVPLEFVGGQCITISFFH